MNEGRDMRKKSQQFTYLVWSFLLMFFLFVCFTNKASVQQI